MPDIGEPHLIAGELRQPECGRNDARPIRRRQGRDNSPPFRLSVGAWMRSNALAGAGNRPKAAISVAPDNRREIRMCRSVPHKNYDTGNGGSQTDWMCSLLNKNAAPSSRWRRDHNKEETYCLSRRNNQTLRRHHNPAAILTADGLDAADTWKIGARHNFVASPAVRSPASRDHRTPRGSPIQPQRRGDPAAWVSLRPAWERRQMDDRAGHIRRRCGRRRCPAINLFQQLGEFLNARGRFGLRFLDTIGDFRPSAHWPTWRCCRYWP